MNIWAQGKMGQGCPPWPIDESRVPWLRLQVLKTAITDETYAIDWEQFL